MVKIGVISDTHAGELSEIAATLQSVLRGVDLIIHAGDITRKHVLDGLESLGQVKAVAGNMDSGELKMLLPQKESFFVAGRKIGLTHGSGAPWGIEERVRDMFDDEDIIVYGHSHQAHNGYVRGSLMFNPGCARDSFGIITIEDGIDATIIKI